MTGKRKNAVLLVQGLSSYIALVLQLLALLSSLLVGKRQANAECQMLLLQLSAESHSTAAGAGELPGAVGVRIWGCYTLEEETQVMFI